LISKAKTPGTWANVNTQSKKYEEFCVKYQLQAYPASPDGLSAFITHLFLEEKGFGTIKNYLSSINTAQQMEGLPPVTQTLKVKLTLAGVKKLTALQATQARPITAAMLKYMSLKVDPTDSEQVAAWAAIVVGFHLLLRKSNLVPDVPKAFSP